MLKFPDPVSTGSHPEALPVSLHISAEVSGGSMGVTKFPKATLQGEAKKNPHLFFVLSLAGPDMQRARCTALLFSLRFLSQQKTERATHKGLSVFHSSSLLAFLWNEKTALYKGHLPRKHILFSLSGAFLSALYFLLVSFHHETKRAHLEPCNVRWFSVNTLIYTITNTQPFSFNSKWMTLWEKKRVVSVVMKRDIWNAHYKVYVFFLLSMHHQNSICIYSKEKRPVFSCWPVLCRFGAGLPAWYVFALTKEASMTKNRD